MQQIVYILITPYEDGQVLVFSTREGAEAYIEREALIQPIIYERVVDEHYYD